MRINLYHHMGKFVDKYIIEEEFVDMSTEDLKQDIDILKQIVNKKHDVEVKFNSLVLILGYLHDNVDHESKLADMLHAFHELVIAFQDLITDSKMVDLSIINEEKSYLDKLDKNIEHVSFRAIIKKEKKILRLEKKELKKIHTILLSMMKVIKRSKLIPLYNLSKQKEDFKKLEIYYFVQIYTFIRAYERIFRHLWRKELILLNKH